MGWGGGLVAGAGSMGLIAAPGLTRLSGQQYEGGMRRGEGAARPAWPAFVLFYSRLRDAALCAHSVFLLFPPAAASPSL